MSAAADAGVLRPATRRTYSSSWWGMASVIMTEAVIFSVLLGTYFFLRASSKQWPLGDIKPPELKLGLIFSVVLWTSSVPIFWAEASIRKGRLGRFKAGVLATFLMGAAFLAYTLYDFNRLEFGWRDNAYGSIYYTTVGLHALHVLVGLGLSLVVQAKAWVGRFDRGRHAIAEVFALYWHFVDVVWLFVFPSLFVSAHIK